MIHSFAVTSTDRDSIIKRANNPREWSRGALADLLSADLKGSTVIYTVPEQCDMLDYACIRVAAASKTTVYVFSPYPVIGAKAAPLPKPPVEVSTLPLDQLKTLAPDTIVLGPEGILNVTQTVLDAAPVDLVLDSKLKAEVVCDSAPGIPDQLKLVAVSPAELAYRAALGRRVVYYRSPLEADVVRNATGNIPLMASQYLVIWSLNLDPRELLGDIYSAAVFDYLDQILVSVGAIDSNYELTPVGTLIARTGLSIYSGLFLYYWMQRYNNPAHFFGLLISAFLDSPIKAKVTEPTILHQWLTAWLSYYEKYADKSFDVTDEDWCEDNSIGPVGWRNFQQRLKNLVAVIGITDIYAYSVEGVVLRSLPVFIISHSKYLVKDPVGVSSYPLLGDYEYVYVLLLDTIGKVDIVTVLPGKLRDDATLPSVTYDQLKKIQWRAK